MGLIAKYPGLILVIAGILWSFSGILIKEIQWTALGIAGVRSLIGAAVQLFFVKNISLRRSGWEWLGVLCISANTIALVFAFQLTRAANAVFLHYAGILFLALMSCPLLGERLSRRDFIAVMMAVIGISCLLGDGLDLGSVQGNCLGIFCGVTFALSQLCLRMQAKAHGNALELIVIANGLTAFVALGIMMCLGNYSLPAHGQDYLFLLLLGLIPWAIPDILYAQAIEHVPAVRAMLLTFLDPALTALWPLLIIRETPSSQGLIGCLLITIGIIWVESGRLARRSAVQAAAREI